MNTDEKKIKNYLIDECSISDTEQLEEILKIINKKDIYQYLEPEHVKKIQKMIKESEKSQKVKKYCRKLKYLKFPNSIVENTQQVMPAVSETEGSTINETIIDAKNIVESEKKIINIIKNNQVIVLRGDTGCGKSSVIPLILLNEYNKIICTQPRRIAAINLAKYTSKKLGDKLGETIGYSVRFKSKCSNKTRLKFVTDGVLLNMLSSNANETLKSYDVIIIDEAHERSINIDIILGFLKKEIKGKKIKLIVMSATLNSNRFLSYFKGAFLTIKSQRFEVKEHYLPSPVTDEFKTVIDTVIRTVSLFETGNILVFMSGKDEINRAVEECNRFLEGSDVSVLPLYADLDQNEQNKVFNNKKRMVVFSTNIAETSVTIDGVRFVIDMGYAKSSSVDFKALAFCLETMRISKEQAKQRKGRAGRTCDGHVFRMYTKDQYNDFEESVIPEVLREDPIQLIMKLLTLRVNDISTFSWIDSPSIENINASLNFLYNLSIINDKLQLTSFGRQISRIPLDCNQALVLYYAFRHGCLHSVAVILSFLENLPIFTHIDENISSTNYKRKKKALDSFDQSKGNIYFFLDIWKKWKESNFNNEFLKKHFLIPHKLQRIKKVYQQLISLMMFKSYTKDSTSNIEECFIFGYFFNIAVSHTDYYITLYNKLPCTIQQYDFLKSKNPALLVYCTKIKLNQYCLVNCLEIQDKMLENVAENIKSKKFFYNNRKKK